MDLIITYTGMQEFIDRLEKLQDIEKPIMQALEEVMSEAEEIANVAYGIQGNGNDDFRSEITREPDGFMLSMIGEDIGFLEFGAGVFTEADEFAQEVDYTVAPGSWSESHEHSDNPNTRYFAKNGFWWWRGFRYTGLTPRRGMQRALDHIRDNILERTDEAVRAWIG